MAAYRNNIRHCTKCRGVKLFVVKVVQILMPTKSPNLIL